MQFIASFFLSFMEPEYESSQTISIKNEHHLDEPNMIANSTR